MTDSHPQPQGLVLIADDDATVRRLLRHVLERDGYLVEEAEDGPETLEIFGRDHPDIVLLDAVMPTMDGFAVCEQIKTLPHGESIPVLMITGLDDQESVDRAFEVGAIDYITKPIHWAVLRQRMRRIFQTRRLEKLRDELTQMIVHDMKNPIITIRGYTQLLLEDFPPDDVHIDSLRRIYRNCDKLLDMAMMILDLGRLQEGKLILQPTGRRVSEVLAEVKESLDLMAEDRQIKLEIDCCDPELTAHLDWELMTRVLVNLATNALKHSPTGSTVVLYTCTAHDPAGHLVFSVIDHGEGIAKQEQSHIFEKFTQAQLRRLGGRTDTGLGLTFCKLATEAHGGQIQVESEPGSGSKFTLWLPL
jgi:signal transduction histidine kinase